ncbi:MAG: DUF6580 family putative transport protein [Candidatus Thalassarchaeum sp.]
MFDAHAVTLGPHGMLLINAAMLSLIGWALWRTERKLASGSDWILLMMLGVFAVSGRVLLEPIPNIQPVTVIVLLAGVHYGAPRAIALATAVTLCSNLILGHGLWSLYQAVGWSAVGVVGALMSNQLLIDGRLSVKRLAIVAAASAFAFDWIVSVSVLHSMGSELLLPYIAAGLPFDLLHAVGNVTFVAWLANPLSEVMSKHLDASPPMAVSESVSSTF